MALERAASLVGLRIPRDTLVARAKQLEEKLGATSAMESLEDQGDYAQAEGGDERFIKQSAYWCPKLREILIAVDITTPRSRTTGGGGAAAAASAAAHGDDDNEAAAAEPPTTTCSSSSSSSSSSAPSSSSSSSQHPLHPLPPPPELTFTQSDLPPGRRRHHHRGDPTHHHGTSPSLTPTHAGHELATYLRSRGYRAVRVRPKLEPMLAANLWESSLIKLVASLAANLCRLLPPAGCRSRGAALSAAAFEALAAGGSPGSFEAGLAILDALAEVHLDLQGAQRLVVIVDELNYAEHATTQDKVSRFLDVLRKICVKNDAPLIFTLSRPCQAVT